MTALAIILAIALVGALAWAFILRRRLATQTQFKAPQSLPSPLFHALAASFDAGLIVIDAERQVRYLNPQAESLLHISHQAAIGTGLIALVRDYQVDALIDDVMRDQEPREMILRPLTSGRTLRLRAAPIASNGAETIALFIRDVTQISMLERSRRDMVANVSHELRTPLASVKLLVETLQSSPPPPVSQRMLLQMAQEVDAITQLVDELHELSQIESGRVALQLTPNALAPVVKRALDRIRPQAERKGLQISANVSETLPMVLIDADRIGQVLLNLLHNAVKFTPDGREITVNAFVVTVEPEAPYVAYVEQRSVDAPPPNLPFEQHQHIAILNGRPAIQMPTSLTAGDWIMITVTDTGMGIPNRDLPRIFERFYKVDRARTRNSGGTGLGLAIAKHLIEGHGGRIWAESQEGSGSTFYCALSIA